MPKETVCRIVRQYNRIPLTPEDMQKLQEIAADFVTVKNYVYQRYGGIRSLSKLYPGYTIQNEMTRSGLREQLNMPSVYFYLAVFDAVHRIKIHWSGVKSQILKQVNAHEGLSEEEKHFLRYLLKVNNAFESALNRTPLKLPKEIQKQYDLLASCVDVKKLGSYLRRQVRKYNRSPRTDAGSADGFSITERAYRYGDHGIYISVKQKRQRIYIPLTDGNQYTRQLYIRLYPEERNVEIRVPVNVSVKKHRDYDRSVGLSMGMQTMLVTDEGHMYGENYGLYQMQLSEWLRNQSSIYRCNHTANPGRKKYQAKKHRLEERLHCYINQELNRFLKEEKPCVVYLPKFPKTGVSGPVRKINYITSTWQRGYIRSRLIQKCEEHSVRYAEVFGKDISNECSRCGAMGKKQEGRFLCLCCGYEADQKRNAAQNAKKRGEAESSSQQLYI